MTPIVQRFAGFACVLLLASAPPGCGSGGGSALDDVLDPGDTSDPGDVSEGCCSCVQPDGVFSRTGVHRVAFTVSQADWDVLGAADRPEVHAALQFDGAQFPDVALRLKGSGSYQGMDGKPGFSIDLNQWVKGTRLEGFKAFRLNSPKSWDPTRTHEWLSYELARASGILAPRIGFAEVWVNGQPFGVYVLAEKHDDVLIAFRNPAQKDLGVLLEPADVFRDLGVGDLDVDGEARLLKAYDEGPKPANPALLAAVLATDALLAGEPSEDAAITLWTRVERAVFLDYLAWEAVVGHFDGYRNLNNWRLFVDGTTRKVEWVASGADITWAEVANADDVFVEHQPPDVTPRALRFCLQVPSCRRGYAERVLAMADRVGTLGLAQRFRELSTLLDACIRSDPRAGFDATEISIQQAYTATALGDRLDAIRDVVYAAYPDLVPAGGSR
jgi:hypothetical protein